MMQLRWLTALATLLAAVATGALAQTADDGAAASYTFKRSTEGGQAVLVSQFARWNKSCQSVGQPNISVSAPPANGTVETRAGSKPITSAGVLGAAECRGHNITSNDVWYVPKPGFHGSDRFEFNVQYTKGTVHGTGVVEVK